MNSKTAIKTVLWLLTVILIFHLSIIVKIVPYEITWGGNLKNDAEMYAFETLSIGMDLLLFTALLIKGEYFKAFIPMKIVNVILWIFLVLFGLNTIGNLLAETYFEKCFAFVTLALSFLLWVILVKNRKRNKTK